MIYHYSLLLEIARQQQQELLHQAEIERCYKQLTEKRSALLQQVAHRLLATVWQLTIHSQPNKATTHLQ